MRKVCLAFVFLGFLGFGGELILAVSTEPPSLDPTTNAAAVIRLLLQGNLYETLVTVDEEGRFRPLLAQSWEVSADGRAYTFYLREQVFFHDGTACDAKAVRKAFCAQKIRNVGMSTPSISKKSRISRSSTTQRFVSFCLVRMRPSSPFWPWGMRWWFRTGTISGKIP